MNKTKYIPLIVAMSIVIYSFIKEPTIGHMLISLGFTAAYMFESYLGYEREKIKPNELSENDELKIKYEKEQILFNIEKVKAQKIHKDTNSTQTASKVRATW